MTMTTLEEGSGEGRSLVVKSSHRNIVLCALCPLLFVVAFGMVSTYSSPATVDMARPGSRFVDITPDQVAWIASLPSLSQVAGNAFAGYLSHRLGRKAVLLFTSVSFTASWLAIAYAPDMSLVYGGRLVSGFCSGVCAVAVPAYLVEISAVEIRGLLTAGFQTAFALGVLVVLGLGACLRWSWLAASGAALVVAAAALTTLVPESPPWLIRNARNVEAFQALKFLRRGYDEAATEFRQIVDQIAEEPREGLTPRELLRPELCRPLVIAVALMAFQQCCGINALMAYSVELFNRVDGLELDPGAAAALLGLVQLLATCLSCLLMDRAGRRALYLTSGIVMTLSLCVSGAHSFLFMRQADDRQGHWWGWVPLVSSVTYVGAYALGFGPVPFVVAPEMVPVRSRSLLLSAACVTGSAFSFAVTRTFDALRAGLGPAGMYWTYAAFAFAGSCFYWTFVPETKGRTIRDIHGAFSRPESEDRRPASCNA